MKKLFIMMIILFVGAVQGAVSLEELRMLKRFGVGISAAGPLSVIGMEFDVNVSESFSIGGGIGSGLDYSSMMVKGRYFLLGQSVSPYIGAGLARWWTSGTKEKNLKPSVLPNRFLSPNQDLTKGFDIFMMYPVFGVQFLHQVGFSVSAELQYLFKLVSFSNGTYAGLSMHWYF